ncbi:cobaltochelatase CobT-related protein [Burkholderia gladioli]|uniref:cobaltochelatase CobT-related protein n=1 Tax=Burkholderia gladioli TaxID=28095 RepID=UPI002FE272D2
MSQPNPRPGTAPPSAGDDPGERLGKLARVLTDQPSLQVRIARDGPRIEWVERDGSAVPDVLVLPATAGEQALSDDELAGWVDLLAARLRLGEPAQHARLASDATRALAETIDDHRASLALAARLPGAATLLARQREAAAREIARRWPKLNWRERFVWRVGRALRGEAVPLTERVDSIEATLGASTELIAAARVSRSTAESIAAAGRIVERVRQLARGEANNMMITVDRETSLDAPATAIEIDPDRDFDAAGPPDARSSSTEPSGAATLADSASSADNQAAGDSAAPPPRPRAELAPGRSIPITTAFDTVTDLTGAGDATAWRKLRGAARAQTTRLKAQLERALARLATSPGYRTPFRTRRVMSGRDTAVTLLIDRSGSMAGRKIELARLCAAALCDALMQLGFACEALGYSSVDDPAMRAWRDRWLAQGHSPRGYNRFVERLDLEIYKRFDSDNPSGLARIDCSHENPDGEALGWAAERLLGRRARRRILMVLSDGYPATGDGDPALLRADLRARIADLGARGVELIGVGILDDAVETFYPTSTVVERLPDLPAVAFETLGRALLGERGRAAWSAGFA